MIREKEKLPYTVRTLTSVDIRNGAGNNFTKIRKAQKDELLTVHAVKTIGTSKWGRNGTEYFCLENCEKL